jgi:hypothetical protein
VSTDQEERARRRDERERDLIAALALIAPTPELLREVIALDTPSDTGGHARRVAITVETETPIPA